MLELKNNFGRYLYTHLLIKKVHFLRCVVGYPESEIGFRDTFFWKIRIKLPEIKDKKVLSVILTINIFLSQYFYCKFGRTWIIYELKLMHFQCWKSFLNPCKLYCVRLIAKTLNTVFIIGWKWNRLNKLFYKL